MPLAYTTEELIAEVRNRAVIGDVESSGWTDADIILYLNAEMLNELVPRISKLQEEYFILTELITLSQDETHIRVPDRAVANSLRDLFLLDGDSRQFLPRINREDLDAFNRSFGDSESVLGYFIEGNHIRVFPRVATIANVQKLELSYRFRPSQLALAANYRTLTSIGDIATKKVTLSGTSVPFSVGDKVDIHHSRSGSEIKTWDNVITDITSQVVTLTDAIDGTDTRKGRLSVELGDYIAPAEQSAIPMLPRETHVILVQAAVCRLIEALDDQEKLKMHTGTLNRWLKNMEYNLGKRVEGRPKKIIGRNSPLWRQGNVQRRSI